MAQRMWTGPYASACRIARAEYGKLTQKDITYEFAHA